MSVEEAVAASLGRFPEDPDVGETCGACQWFKPVIRRKSRGRCGKAAALIGVDLYRIPSFPSVSPGCRFWRGYAEAEE